MYFKTAPNLPERTCFSPKKQTLLHTTTHFQTIHFCFVAIISMGTNERNVSP